MDIYSDTEREALGLIIKDTGNYLENQIAASYQIISSYELPGDISLIYVNWADALPIIEDFGLLRPATLPTVYTLLDRASLDAAGITQLQSQPYMDLDGQGVLMGFIDTGIDYTLPTFRYEDGTTKILSLWDQSAVGEAPDNYHFGVEYTDTEINLALNSDTPYAIVPQQDYNGHGTFLASLAAGRPVEDFVGAAPGADIICVKLRQASEFTREESLIPPQANQAFESSDVMLGIDYLLQKAAQLQRPLSVCIALGTNSGGHDGFNPLEEYLSSISSRTGVCISVAAGNESQARHHTSGLLPTTGSSQAVDIRVPEQASSFITAVWNNAADRISVAVRSPSGETVGRIQARNGTTYESGFVFEKSRVTIRYYYPVGAVGAQLTTIRIYHPTPGIWSIVIYGDIVNNGSYHLWLPITGLGTPGLEFLTPDPYYTVVIPATTIGVITSGAYDSRTQSLYINSSWGPTRLPVLNPDFVAPGVNVGAFYPTGYGTMSGTSVASAIVAGAGALLLQWGILNGNDTALNTYRIRSILISGCIQDEGQTYPSMQWGYGKVNLYNSFNSMRTI